MEYVSRRGFSSSRARTRLCVPFKRDSAENFRLHGIKLQSSRPPIRLTKFRKRARLGRVESNRSYPCLINEVEFIAPSLSRFILIYCIDPFFPPLLFFRLFLFSSTLPLDATYSSACMNWSLTGTIDSILIFVQSSTIHTGDSSSFYRTGNRKQRKVSSDPLDRSSLFRDVERYFNRLRFDLRSGRYPPSSSKTKRDILRNLGRRQVSYWNAIKDTFNNTSLQQRFNSFSNVSLNFPMVTRRDNNSTERRFSNFLSLNSPKICAEIFRFCHAFVHLLSSRSNLFANHFSLATDIAARTVLNRTSSARVF